MHLNLHMQLAQNDAYMYIYNIFGKCVHIACKITGTCMCSNKTIVCYISTCSTIITVRIVGQYVLSDKDVWCFFSAIFSLVMCTNNIIAMGIFFILPMMHPQFMYMYMYMYIPAYYRYMYCTCSSTCTCTCTAYNQ